MVHSYLYRDKLVEQLDVRRSIVQGALCDSNSGWDDVCRLRGALIEIDTMRKILDEVLEEVKTK